MKRLSIGKKIKEGVELAEIGNYPYNGNCSPHLHFQIIIDLVNISNDPASELNKKFTNRINYYNKIKLYNKIKSYKNLKKYV